MLLQSCFRRYPQNEEITDSDDEGPPQAPRRAPLATTSSVPFMQNASLTAAKSVPTRSPLSHTLPGRAVRVLTTN